VRPRPSPRRPTPQSDVTNWATATGADELKKEFSDKDDASVDVLKPGIKITKTADPTVIHSGDLVTYTFLVENTGDCKLYNIMVTDDVLGAIGGPFDLDKGETKTLTKTANPTSDVTNWATATGPRDELKKEFSDKDRRIPWTS